MIFKITYQKREKKQRFFIKVISKTYFFKFYNEIFKSRYFTKLTGWLEKED